MKYDLSHMGLAANLHNEEADWWVLRKHEAVQEIVSLPLQFYKHLVMVL